MDMLSALFQESYFTVFNYSGDKSEFAVMNCSQEFDADYTFVLFPWVKKLGLKPEEIGLKLGEYLLNKNSISGYFVVKGFFNFTLHDNFWIDEIYRIHKLKTNELVVQTDTPLKYLVEYCSPNTNKPLHLGHIRNILLGWSLSNILKAIGHRVETTQVINDRGVAICKSMLAWKKFSNGETPESTGIKPDHFVGDYYVLFDKKLNEEYLSWQNSDEGKTILKNLLGQYVNSLNSDPSVNDEKITSDLFKKYKNDYFNTYSVLGKEVREMLLKWENHDQETRLLWKKMNDWVYLGFNESFKKLNVSFDYIYYESNTYLLGKDIVELGLNKGVFYQLPDRSVWVNLEDVGLDNKIVLRSDGTSVYITQDLGTIKQRYERHHSDKYIYIVADEQDYHFKVLFETVKKLGEPYAHNLYHCSYGMVDLPTGKMKSREGTVVDADDLIAEVIHEATSMAEERGEIAALPKEQKDKICTDIALAALKYFILKVSYKKRMIFDPKESVDMQGHTGPYIVNAYVRIQSILRKATFSIDLNVPAQISRPERNLIRSMNTYDKILFEAADSFDPAHLANYLYQLAKDFHKYYHDHRILNAETAELINFRLMICENVAKYLTHGMNCLGISMPDRM
ncbi:MAG TPA: arginine--tRNA ligase [Saprospiraceae bacterium]|nr:arginine--tRNA ligase [Saprospiraceae bacterium]